MGGAKSQHGTRTATRVRCGRCGKIDHVPGRQRKGPNLLCSACAEELLGLYEEGVHTPRKMREADCVGCGTHFELPVSVELEEVLCPDCLRGFATWQGPTVKRAGKKKPLADARRPGVRLRKRDDVTADEP